MVFARSHEEIMKYQTSKTSKIKDIEIIDEDVAQVSLENILHKRNYVNRNANCIIGTMIVDLAKIAVYEATKTLRQNGCHVMYVNTDGIIFTRKKGTPIPLSIGSSYGEFSHQVPDGSITELIVTGSKSYAYWYGSNRHCLRLSGFSLESKLSQDSLNASVFKQNAEKFFEEFHVSKISVPQLRKCTSSSMTSVKSQIRLNHFAANIFKKRILVKRGNTYLTLPYGVRL